MRLHPLGRRAVQYAVYAPCTGDKPLRFTCRVRAYDSFNRLCRVYGAENCRIE